MGRLISSWLRLPGAAWAPLPRGSCLLTLSAQPGLAGSEQESQPWGELQASNTQGQGAGEELEAMPRIWGLGEHQMFQKAWLRKFLVSLLSVLVSC